jgi:hypothetical protein
MRLVKHKELEGKEGAARKERISQGDVIEDAKLNQVLFEFNKCQIQVQYKINKSFMNI